MLGHLLQSSTPFSLINFVFTHSKLPHVIHLLKANKIRRSLTCTGPDEGDGSFTSLLLSLSSLLLLLSLPSSLSLSPSRCSPLTQAHGKFSMSSESRRRRFRRLRECAWIASTMQPSTFFVVLLLLLSVLFFVLVFGFLKYFRSRFFFPVLFFSFLTHFL